MFSQILIFGIIVVALTCMKNSLSKRVYLCKCKSLVDGYAWDNELATIQFKCNKCGNFVGYEQLKKKVVVQTTSIRTPTKNR